MLVQLNVLDMIVRLATKRERKQCPACSQNVRSLCCLLRKRSRTLKGEHDQPKWGSWTPHWFCLENQWDSKVFNCIWIMLPNDGQSPTGRLWINCLSDQYDDQQDKWSLPACCIYNYCPLGGQIWCYCLVLHFCFVILNADSRVESRLWVWSGEGENLLILIWSSASAIYFSKKQTYNNLVNVVSSLQKTCKRISRGKSIKILMFLAGLVEV